jgi:mRNA-degrading endonuclease RelE of RelBE toxin-antitoxin system
MVKKSAAKEFAGLPRAIQERLSDAMEEIAKDPRRPRAGLDAKRLKGTTDGWRLRIGDYRGICEIEGSAVTFTRFGHRSRIHSP